MSGNLKVTPTAIPGVLILEPRVFGDERGFFLESFNQRAFNEATGLDVQFVQDNHSRSAKGVLRGLHYQLPPHEQGKLVRVVRGSVFDVAVDIRRDSPTFGSVSDARTAPVRRNESPPATSLRRAMWPESQRPLVRSRTPTQRFFRTWYSVLRVTNTLWIRRSSI